MHNYHLSILLGLTTTVAVGAPLSVRAATFNFDQLQNISSRPIDSEYSLNLLGEPSENQGFTAFFNLDPSAPDFGHTDISLNSRGDGAPYYNTGRQGSPEVPPSGTTRTSSVSEIAGFPTLSSFLTNNGISFSSLGFGFGQRSDRDFTATWNLGDDILGQDWFASPDSTIEERIYAANPDDVEIFLTFSTTKIVSFGYSDIYAALDYGASLSLSDDIDAAFTDPVTATKVAGLDPFADALADALLQDISTAGGAAQIVVEDTAVEEGTFTTGNGFGILNFQFVGSLRAVPSATVPEPTSALGILMFGALGAVSHLKKQKNKRVSSTYTN